jgi:hypothetical protein
MMSKKSSIIITAIVTLVSFFTITWLSCSKPSKNPSCNGVVCENGGRCAMDSILGKLEPQCICPAGFEGPFCATVEVNKYIGTWDIKQHIDWSDSVKTIGTDTTYSVDLAKTATNTTFFINNFFNNANYNNIICDIDSANSSYFTIDTLSDFHEFYDHYQIKSGYGQIYANDSIIGHMFIRFLTGTTNWHQDSVTIRLYPHHF